MKKVVRDGKVAVLVSRGYGAGWYSWHNIEELLYSPEVVDMVERGVLYQEIESYVELQYPDIYAGGASGLYIVWVPVGSKFRIKEYDGAESLVLLSEEKYLEA